MRSTASPVLYCIHLKYFILLSCFFIKRTERSLCTSLRKDVFNTRYVLNILYIQQVWNVKDERELVSFLHKK